jgi:hypothetical protein
MRIVSIPTIENIQKGELDKLDDFLVFYEDRSDETRMTYGTYSHMVLEDTEDFEEKVYKCVNELLKMLGYV